MGLEIKTLPMVSLGKSLPCTKPDSEKNTVTDDHPAIQVMTDFTVVSPVTIEPFLSLDLALDRMKTMGVRLLLVTDDHDDICGVITSYDLQGEKPIRYAETTGVGHREMNVGMIMTPITDTPAVDLDHVQQSLVRHIINSMKQLDRPHMLVVENLANGRQRIRGLFSTSQIGKLLGRRIYEPLRPSRSLAEISGSIG
jgi:hypothetical protein